MFYPTPGLRVIQKKKKLSVGHLGLEEELEGVVEHDHAAPSLQG